MHDCRRTNLSTPSACAATAEGCALCDIVPPAPWGDKSTLLLVPYDHDAEAVLEAVLTTSQLSFAKHHTGSILVAAAPEAAASALSSGLSEITQKSVGAAVINHEVNEKTLVRAAARCRPLSHFLERMRYEWVRPVLSNDQLFSMLHPIVSTKDGSVFAYEMLLRARKPGTNEVIGAWPIIEACEKLHLQHQLDQRARECAIRNAAPYRTSNQRFFINFLPNTIYDPEVCLRTTMRAASEYEVNLKSLVFEIVETEHIDDMAHLKMVLDYYRSRGVCTAVDDMGAGHTSIEYLRELHPDFVKIDRDIVVNAVHDEAVREELHNIVEVAKNLGIQVIMEGLETPEQVDVCLSAGADYVQGFYFARPANPPQQVNNVQCLMRFDKAA